jgi:5-methylcytosine-specific restriction endonuclease McrA
MSETEFDADAVDQLLRNGWSQQSVRVWLRAQGYCEYCKCDLLSSADSHFFGSELDHIVPDGTDGTGWSNLALSCKPCNYLKRRTRFDDGEVHVPREQLIARASEYIRHKRERNEARLERSVELLKRCGLQR